MESSFSPVTSPAIFQFLEKNSKLHPKFLFQSLLDLLFLSIIKDFDLFQSCTSFCERDLIVDGEDIFVRFYSIMVH